MAEPMKSDPVQPPLRKIVIVPWSQEAAFRRFTTGIDTWWPRSTHSVGQERAVSVALEERVGGRIYEQLDDGSVSVWGTVLRFEAPSELAFTWHPGREPETAQEVSLIFTGTPEGTKVELTHSGWDVLGESAAETRADYDRGWDTVLGVFSGSDGQ